MIGWSMKAASAITRLKASASQARGWLMAW